MPRLTLQYPIHTLDNQLLFPPGTLLTEKVLSEVICSLGTFPDQTHPLDSYRTIRKDCLNFLSTHPYDIIFSDKKEIDELFSAFEAVRLPAPVLQSFDYFKEEDFYTYAHILMVFLLSTLLAKDLVPDYQKCVRLYATGPTHDTGKICVPLSILKKTTPLSKREHGLIKHHTVAGYVLLSYYFKDATPLACKVAFDHHERRDASGYPRGIPLKDSLVEIVAVSDIYDALIKPRPYRSGPYDNRTALEEVTKAAEQNKIKWNVAMALIARNRKSRPNLREMKISAEKRGTPPSYNVHGIIADEKNNG
ncbi:MAG: HD domain-containing phosphohydrolase [Thermodesulfobacteriota bacterium]